MTQRNCSSDSRKTSTSGRIGRRTFIRTGTAATVLGLAGCTATDEDGEGTGTETKPTGDDTESGSNTTAKAGEDAITLRVSVWSGNYANFFEDTVKQLYEEETGNTLEVIPGWNEIISKIKAAPENNPPYDVSVTDGYFYHQGMADDLFMEIDYDNVPNIDNVYPCLTDFWTTDCGIPTDRSPISIIYNSGSID